MDDTCTLRLDGPTAEVLACALLQAIDDLEARALVAEHRDAGLGPASATEYRSDARRLQQLLAVVAPDSRAPRPDRVAVRWIEGTWTIDDDRPVRLHRTDELQALLAASLALVDRGALSPQDALSTVHHLVTNDTLGTTGLTPARHRSTRPAHAPAERPTDEPGTTPGPTPSARHRLAPVCEPAPTHGIEPEVGGC